MIEYIKKFWKSVKI